MGCLDFTVMGDYEVPLGSMFDITYLRLLDSPPTIINGRIQGHP